MQPRSIFRTRRLSSQSTVCPTSLSLKFQKRAKSFTSPLGITPSTMLSLTSRRASMRQFTASLSAESPPTITIVLYPLFMSMRISRSTLSVFSLCTKSYSTLCSSSARCTFFHCAAALPAPPLGQYSTPQRLSSMLLSIAVSLFLLSFRLANLPYSAFPLQKSGQTHYFVHLFFGWQRCVYPVDGYAAPLHSPEPRHLPLGKLVYGYL